MKTYPSIMLIIAICIALLLNASFALAQKKKEHDPTIITPDMEVLIQFDKENAFIRNEYARLLELVNDIRSKGCTCGTRVMPPVKTLEWDDTLSTVSLLHSYDMYKRNYFAHKTPEGFAPWHRYMIYTNQINLGIGENIMLFHSGSIINGEAAFKGWLNSPGHCTNMMDESYNYMGAGFYMGRFTQMFMVNKSYDFIATKELKNLVKNRIKLHQKHQEDARKEKEKSIKRMKRRNNFMYQKARLGL